MIFFSNVYEVVTQFITAGFIYKIYYWHLFFYVCCKSITIFCLCVYECQNSTIKAYLQLFLESCDVEPKVFVKFIIEKSFANEHCEKLQMHFLVLLCYITCEFYTFSDISKKILGLFYHTLRCMVKEAQDFVQVLPQSS